MVDMEFDRDDRGREERRREDRDPDDRGLRRILEGLVGRCIQFDLVSGRMITGIVREVMDGVVRLSVAGRTVWIVINKIEAFRQTTGQAC